MEKSEAKEIVLMLVAAFPAAKGDAEAWRRTLSVYAEMLADLDRDVTRQAVTRLIATSKWMPTIAEIRSAVADLTLGPRRAGGEAWQDAVGAARRVGRYDTPQFADPLVGEALRLWGSWEQFCGSPEEDPGGRARFIELYDSLAVRERQDAASGIPLLAAGDRRLR